MLERGRKDVWGRCWREGEKVYGVDVGVREKRYGIDVGEREKRCMG